MSLGRIIRKVNQAKSAVRSFKGLKSQYRNINYNSVINSDELETMQSNAKQVIDNQRIAVKNLYVDVAARRHAKQPPTDKYIVLEYPLEEALENAISFKTRGRKQRPQAGMRGKNIFSKEDVEIFLYIPDELNSTAAVSYETENVGHAMRGGAIKAAGGADKWGGGFLPSGDSVAGGFIEGLKQGWAAGIQKLGNKLTGGASFLLQGQATNPMAEQMLKGVDFRSFTFNYIFFPRSQREAQMVNSIIYSFRTAMLPDTFPVFGGLNNDVAVEGLEGFFNYPNVFDVNYHGPIAKKLDGFLPMVCTQCNVNHTGGLKFSTYRDGQPIKTTMSLSFLEIKILTQETYNNQVAPLGDKTIGAGSESIVDNTTGGT